jgi:hypothetical protein
MSTKCLEQKRFFLLSFARMPHGLPRGGFTAMLSGLNMELAKLYQSGVSTTWFNRSLPD